MCELGFAGRVAIFGWLGPEGTSTHRLVDLLCVFLKAAQSLENALVAFVCFAASPGQPHFASDFLRAPRTQSSKRHRCTSAEMHK